MRRPIAVTGAVLIATAWGFLDGSFVTPWPAGFCIATLIGAICLVTDASGPGVARGRAVADGVAEALAISALVVAIQSVLPVLMAHMHRIPGAADAVAPLANALGLPAGADAAGNLLVGTAAGTAALSITWELAALPALLRLLAGLAVIGGVSALPRHALLLAVYAVVRVLLLLALVAGGARIALCYEPAVTLLSFLPLAFTMTRPGPALPAARAQAPGRSAVRAALATALLTMAGAIAGFCLGHQEPGSVKKGRVVIDESRGGWEPTGTPFDHALYGQQSLYNYGLWKSWIELHYPTRVVRERLTARDLRDADLLIIKTPTAPYDARSIRRIERFVRSGGGLYLIGDHTNLFGMSTVLNAVGSSFGIAFEHDDTFPLDHETYDIFTPGSAAHPILRGIEAYPFETSCSLRVPWSAEHLVIGRRLGAEPVDYGHVNFFGNMRLDPSETFGRFTQAAAVRHGRGRIVVFADSTNFSNFSMLWPGRRELTLNVLDWLNRESPRQGTFDWMLPAAALAAAMTGAAALIRCGKWARALALWAGVSSFAGVLPLAAALTAASFHSPPARQPIKSVAFDTELSDFDLEEASPILNLSGDPAWDGFNTFFINAARSGVWPAMTTDFSAALRSHGVVVLVHPVRHPTGEQMRALARFLKAGGSVLIVDSILSTRSTASRIAGPFGLAAEREIRPIDVAGRRPMVPALWPVAAGGTHRRVLRGGGVALWRRVGAGRLVLATDAALFSDRAFGGVYTTPGGAQREAYRGQGELFQILLETQKEETPG